ncbi:MAG: NADH-quinone oxidoreductase subunit N, partial [Actinobacteria bacterium]|nr:NADH-quinone oxidoreductase subunit N [Actinomycetota bacterium]
VLVADLFLGPRTKGLLAWLAAAVLVVAMAVAVGQWVTFSGGLSFSGRDPETGFAGMVVMDKLGLFFVLLFGVAGLLTILLGDAYLAARGAVRGEFYALLLLVIAGMIGLATATDLISFFVAFELMSLPTYVLAGYARRDPLAGEASLKYFINGAFSSAILLFGFAVLYAISGSTTFSEISAGLVEPLPGQGAAIVGFVLIAAGFGFKIAAVPFHGWAPDAYQGAPTPVTTFMSVGIKAAAFAGFLRLFAAALLPAWEVWTPVLMVLAVVTMIVGNVLALPQRNIKRLLAYSSIAHAGYLLLGIIALGEAGDQYGSSAVLVYLVAYTFMNVGAFGMLVFIRNSRPFFRYTLDELRGYGRAAPLPALAFTLFMLSLTGIPPTAGFWGKFYLFGAVVDAGETWLAIVAVVMSAVSAFYYLRIVWYMYFEAAADVLAPGRSTALPAAAAAAATPADRREASEHPAGDAGSSSVMDTMAADDPPATTASPDSPSHADRQPVDAHLVETDTGTVAALLLAAAAVLFIGIWPQGLVWAAQGAVRLLGGG